MKMVPGYKKIKIQPHIGGNLTQASATLETYYGRVSSGWKLENGKLFIDTEVPPNTTATVFIPTLKEETITESGVTLSSSKDIEFAGTKDGCVLLKIGSGKYHFEIMK